MKLSIVCAVVAVLSFIPSLSAQTAGSSASGAQVPPFIQFSNLATGLDGRPMTGVVGVTFYLYKEQEGGAPLWMETQNVHPDKAGHYTVLLGSTTSQGLPANIFASAEAHWLGMQVQGQDEQPRVLLVSAPYALKAADAETVGGLPPSAFVLAAPGGASGTAAGLSSSVSQNTRANVGGNGSVDYIPLWIDNIGDLGNSILYQLGAGPSAKVGINEKNPLFTLDVNGQELVRGLFEMATTNYASPAKGYNSQPFNLESSSYNSGTAKYTLNHFQWQAEPTGNNTATPGATLNLLYGTDPASPTETGLQLSSTGLFTFAAGQTFPGTGTITGVTTAAGSGLTGGGNGGTLSLALTNTCSANQILQWSGTAWTCVTGFGTVTGVTAGTDLTGGGTTGNVTLNLDTTKVPQLNTANMFIGNQTMNGNLTATGVVSASSYQIGSNLFAFGSYANGNSYLGFSGNSATTGSENSASGVQALLSNTTGAANTAFGYGAMEGNTTGGDNTAVGWGALVTNSVGIENTALGVKALFNNTSGGNTATGYEALYSNTLGDANTAYGYQAMFSNTGDSTAGSYNTASGYQALYSNTTGGVNVATGFGALYSNTTGNGNVANGYQALYSNTTAYGNTADGETALGGNTTGVYNTASGNSALSSNQTGAQNTAVGVMALYLNVTGSDLTCIGYECDLATDGLSNATAIGAHAIVGQSNSLVLGGTGQYAVKVGIGTTTPSNILTIGRGLGHPVSDSWETYSSRRWKTNIQTLPGALAKVEQLRGVTYDLKDSGKHEIGVIAEEVGKVVPEIVTYEDNGKDARGVDYSRLTALLIEATKEQQREFRKQQAELTSALHRIKAQQSLLQAQASAMRSLKAEVRETRETLQKVRAVVAAAQPALVATK